MATFVPYINIQLQLILYPLIILDTANVIYISCVWLFSVMEPDILLTWPPCPFLKLVVYLEQWFQNIAIHENPL